MPRRRAARRQFTARLPKDSPPAVCRRKGCGYSERANDSTIRRCPTDHRKLWPKSIVRPIRFHHLRHTTGSLMMMAGANPGAVQRMLRHSDPRITMEFYAHLAPGYLRDEVDRLRFGTQDEPATEAAPVAVNAAPFAASLLQDPPETLLGAESDTRKPPESPAFMLSGTRVSNPRPSAWEATPDHRIG